MNDNEEQRIKNAILDWILFQPRKGFAWSQYNGAVYDVRRKCFRKRSKYALKGVPDIIGLWVRRPLFLEIKKPGGIASPEQKDFIRRARSHGAIAAIVYSYDEAVRFLDQFKLEPSSSEVLRSPSQESCTENEAARSRPPGDSTGPSRDRDPSSVFHTWFEED